MNPYPVKMGETITDVVINATGNIDNWDLILTANGFTDWTPALKADQLVIIPDTVVVNANTLRDMQAKPICNNARLSIFQQIDNIVSVLANNWILATGRWNDKGVWLDDAHWQDNPPV